MSLIRWRCCARDIHRYGGPYEDVIQAANDERARADHETLTSVNQLAVEVHAINEAQTAILKQLQSNSASA